jgi:hypothetical protein
VWVDRRDAQDFVVVVVFVGLLYLLMYGGSC